MSIWTTKYGLSALPEEQRAEVMKVRISEEEMTKRKALEEKEKTKQEKLGNGDHQIVRGLFVFFLAVCLIPIGIVLTDAIRAWKQVRMAGIAPMDCPVCPECRTTCPACPKDTK